MIRWYWFDYFFSI